MAATAETLQEVYETEPISRRTDKLLFNVYYLQDHILDKQKGVFDPRAEADVLEQDITILAEGDIHSLGATVYQELDEVQDQYISLEIGTIDNNIKGLEALDTSDPDALFEFYRRVEEVTDEVLILEPEIRSGMTKGGIKVFASPAPTHHEVDPDVAESFGYDDRTMFRMQALSPDGKTKKMISFSVFDVPAKAWAAFLGDRYGEVIEPTALAVMQFCHRLPLEFKSTNEVLQEFIGGVAEYLPEKDRDNVLIQLDAFLKEQIELEAQARFYALEKLAIQKELALCLGGPATPEVVATVKSLSPYLNTIQKQELSKRQAGDKLTVDHFVAELVVKMKTVTTNNRAGLATMNTRTMQRATSKMGLEATIALVHQEQLIRAQRDLGDGSDTFMTRRADELIAEAGLECGGSCTPNITNLFSDDALEAREVGIEGTLYESKELNENSKCSCADKKKARVKTNGKDVMCNTCGDYIVKGRQGNAKKRSLKAA